MGETIIPDAVRTKWYYAEVEIPFEFPSLFKYIPMKMRTIERRTKELSMLTLTEEYKLWYLR